VCKLCATCGCVSRFLFSFFPLLFFCFVLFCYMTASMGDIGPVGQCRGSKFGFFFIGMQFVLSYMTHSVRHIALQPY